MPRIVDDEEHFWKQPLGAWIKDCVSGCDALIPESAWRAEDRRESVLRFSDLCDGFVFNLLFVFVDTDSLNLVVMREGVLNLSDMTSRMKHFSTLIHNIYTFYRSRLNKLIVTPLPDVLTILRNPHPDGCGAEINKVLLLLLGCAVQGDQRDRFIERIKRMQTDLQNAIVTQIQRVTEEGECVLNAQSLELDTSTVQSACVLAHLERVIKERDTYANCLLEMAHEHESDEGSTTTGASSISGELPSRNKLPDIRYEGRTPSPTSLERHANVELASAKAELRKLRNLTEEKDDQVTELRDELEARDASLLKMQQERLELVKDARAAKDYRDELDCLQHKLTKLERLETDNTKLREKLAEMDFFKSRITQLKEENDLMHESCSVLEEQLEQSQRKANANLDLETKLGEWQSQFKDLQSEMTKEREKIERLLLENGRLERGLNTEKQKSAALERRVESLSEQRSAREDFGSLGSQMADDDKKRILELELENRKLKSKLQSGCDSEVGELRAKLLRAEIELSTKNEENSLASQQLEEFEITLTQVEKQYKETCKMFDAVKAEKDTTQESLHEARKNFSEFQAEFQKEMKCDLDKKTRELETSVSTKERLLSSAVEEKVELERQLERILNEQKELRLDNESLKENAQKAEESAAHAERMRKGMEADRNTLKERNEILEQRLDDVKVKQMNAENIEKRLDACDHALSEKQNRLSEVQAEHRQIAQQLELEVKKTDRLREDLVAEKSHYADLISRLRSVCATIEMNGGRCEVPSDDESMLRAIDDVILRALSHAKRESDTLRMQQHAQIAELRDLKKDIEKLRKSEGYISIESDDRLRDLSIENRNVKEQVFLLQERIRDLQLDNSAKTAEVSSLKREIEETQRGMTSSSKLHTELAKLQVSQRNLQLQEELLRQDNKEMQKQVEICETQKQAVKSDLDGMQAVHTALLSDHDRLQTLHDMLTADYDRAKYDNSQLKQKLKTYKNTAEEVTMMKAENERERMHIEELKTVIADEKDLREKETRALHNDLAALRLEYEHIRQENNSLKRKTEMQAEELKRLRAADQANRSTIGRLNANVNELSRVLQNRDITMSKMQNKIDMLNHLNRTLEEESKTLARQMDHLLLQNQDLLAKALNDKDNYHAEQREFQEKLVALRRHKEKLEEKIMEQYRMMDNKKTVKEKQTLVKRAAKALIPKSPKKYLINNNKSLDHVNASESPAEDSSVYSMDEPSSIHQSSPAPSHEGQYPSQHVRSPPPPLKYPPPGKSPLPTGNFSPSLGNLSQPDANCNQYNRGLANFPRNATVRISSSEKRGSAFPIRFASLRLRSRSSNPNPNAQQRNVNPALVMERSPSQYDNLNHRIHI